MRLPYFTQERTIGQIGLEVQLEHPQRLFHISGRRGDGYQRQHRVALADVVLDPFLVDGDIALEEAEARMAHQVRDAVGLHVHSVHLPAGGVDDALGQVVTDEAVDAEDADAFHGWAGVRVGSRTGGVVRTRWKLRSSSILPSTSKRQDANSPAIAAFRVAATGVAEQDGKP